MRGDDPSQGATFSYLTAEQRIPTDHPLRPIREMANEVLRLLSPRFEELYSRVGRPSIAPERLLRALLLQLLYSIRSELGGRRGSTHFGESPDGHRAPIPRPWRWTHRGGATGALAGVEKPNSQRSFSSQRRDEPVSKHLARRRLRWRPNCDPEGSPRRSAARHRARHRWRESPWREADEAITAAEPQGRLSIGSRELPVRHSQHDADRLGGGMNCRGG
jgi:hypothetical protein